MIQVGKRVLQKHIDEALARFNGYWAWDYQQCDNVADEYGYDREFFKLKVYEHLNSNKS